MERTLSLNAVAKKYNETSPKKQQVKSGLLVWGPDNYTGAFDLARAFCLVRRVRNNLFHGGKFPEGREEDVSRDQELLNAGIEIMQACQDDQGSRWELALTTLEQMPLAISATLSHLDEGSISPSALRISPKGQANKYCKISCARKFEALTWPRESPCC
jgi:hypothetical protein